MSGNKIKVIIEVEEQQELYRFCLAQLNNRRLTKTKAMAAHIVDYFYSPAKSMKVRLGHYPVAVKFNAAELAAFLTLLEGSHNKPRAYPRLYRAYQKAVDQGMKFRNKDY